MKKLFAILLTLLMIVALPLAAVADEVVTSHDPSETAEDIVLTIGGEEVPENQPSEETEILDEEDAPKTQFGFFPETLAETLPVMGMGMLGIFLVIGVIVLAVIILSKVGKKDEED